MGHAGVPYQAQQPPAYFAAAALALHRSAIWLIILLMTGTNLFFLAKLAAEPHRVFHLW
jgi:hypothetical protein